MIFAVQGKPKAKHLSLQPCILKQKSKWRYSSQICVEILKVALQFEASFAVPKYWVILGSALCRTLSPF